MSTPLARVRGLGSARSGADHWWVQRLTAIALVPLSLWFIWAVIALTGEAHATARAWAAEPFNAVMLVVLVIATFHHAQLGLQVVIEDYVHHEGAKIASLVAMKFLSFVLALAGVFAVVRIALGS
ncbi:MAG: succinate dehydrogenase, hydrophobic membrane anchor protein [Acetobacterales bacterium]